MKSILLIGLGRFGIHMAQKLHELHHEVLAVDSNEERVNNVMDFVTNAQIGDSTNEAFIASLGVRNFDVCVVAIGDNFQSSLETTALLKENGAPFVLARASREVHAKFLLTNGADDVIYPEKQMASWAAVRYSSEHIFDYIELTDDYSIYEMEVPRSWVGSTIVQVSSRQKYRFNILATKRDGRLDPLPEANHRFMADESIFSLYDARRIIEGRAADMFNIKLMKAGGIYEALKINALAQSYDMTCMVGSMIETKLGVTAAAHFAASQSNILYYDFDAPLMLKEETVDGGIVYDGSRVTFTDAPGLGIGGIKSCQH